MRTSMGISFSRWHLVRCLAEAERIRPPEADQTAEMTRRSQELLRLARDLRTVMARA
jgi:hypothetical protein